jgi:enoyl-CoA hydratase
MDLKAYLVGEDVTLPGRGLAGICTWSPRKPLIAAVEGWALAGGCEVALACDLIVAAEDAWFGISEVKRGLAAGGGGMLRLPRLLPPAIAMEMALTGDPLPATRAAGYGLVNVLTPSGGALEGALALAGRITPNAPLGLEVSKEIVRTAGDRPIEDEFAAQIPLMDMLFRSADSKEGARAFAEKRPPEWTGQ